MAFNYPTRGHPEPFQKVGVLVSTNTTKSESENYRLKCRNNNVDYVPIKTDDSLDKTLIEYLIKRKKMS